MRFNVEVAGKAIRFDFFFLFITVYIFAVFAGKLVTFLTFHQLGASSFFCVPIAKLD